MKRNTTKIFVITMLITALAMIFGGCNKIQYGKPYNEYYFQQNEGTFVKSGSSLSFYEDMTFTMNLAANSDDTIPSANGTYTKYDKENMYSLNFATNFTDEMLAAYKTYLEELSGISFNVNQIKDMLSAITYTQAIYQYKDFLFTTANVEAYRLVEDAGASYLNVEGTYTVKGWNQPMLLEEGKIYVYNKSTNTYDTERGYYEVNGDFLAMYITVENSDKTTTQYVIKYLIGEMALPMDLQINKDEVEEKADTSMTETESWIEAINGELSKLEGKKIKVLVRAFYSAKSI